MSQLPILIVEDERALSLAIAATVQKCGGTPKTVSSLALARTALREGAVQGIVLDIGLPDGNGLSLLESIPEELRPPTILVTAHGQIENAIAARKLGVREFFDKPINFEAFSSAIRTLLEQAAAPEKESTSVTSTFIGAAPSMRSVFQKIAHSCASREPVLIIGQTGTGKSTAAKLIANHCDIASGNALHSLHAAQGSGELKEILSRIGSGILCIDPISDLDDDCQTILAEALNSNPKFRLIATALPELFHQVSQQQFRSDLFYRLQVLEIRLPLLKARLEDIPVLVNYFLGQIDHSRIIGIDDSFYTALINYDWPGNLRELLNVTTYAYTMGKGALTLTDRHLPDLFHNRAFKTTTATSDESLSAAIDKWLGETNELESYRNISGNLERLLIKNLLNRFDGKIAPMASALGANRTTIRKKLSAN